MARVDRLEFLSDIVPRTTTFGEFKARRGKEPRSAVKKAARALAPGQKTLDLNRPESSGAATKKKTAAAVPIIEAAEAEAHSTTQPANGASQTNGNGTLVFEHYEPNGVAKHDESDVEMS